MRDRVSGTKARAPAIIPFMLNHNVPSTAVASGRDRGALWWVYVPVAIIVCAACVYPGDTPDVHRRCAREVVVRKVKRKCRCCVEDLPGGVGDPRRIVDVVADVPFCLKLVDRNRCNRCCKCGDGCDKFCVHGDKGWSCLLAGKSYEKELYVDDSNY
ncbi:hypothetical protein F4859DRAFT_524350, partial [Xylaria cf. heliscus]